jgi:hypothetical protein
MMALLKMKFCSLGLAVQSLLRNAMFSYSLDFKLCAFEHSLIPVVYLYIGHCIMNNIWLCSLFFPHIRKICKLLSYLSSLYIDHGYIDLFRLDLLT